MDETDNRKLISVIMAAYNCEDTIRDSVESILSQTYTAWEMIICDDGSNDRTFDILKEYETKFPEKITVLRNKKNSKLPYSLNRCLKHAKGYYVARMDADDKSYPTRFEKQIAYLEAHPTYDVVGTAMTCFDGDGIIGVRHPEEKPGPKCIGRTVPFFHATIMMKKSVYNALGGYSLKPYVIRCEDVDLWIRFFGNGYKGVNIDEALYCVREDLAASKRRNLKGALNASITLWNGFRKFHYPINQYIFVVKPIIANIIPYQFKFWINKNRWK